MGARPINRIMQKLLENKLSTLLISNELQANSHISFSIKNEEIIYKIKAK
jgi:ATP-dependent Clp protease ATP-binding subunit ClpA